ncbi:MAG: PEP/pyruvate-binding domain-containing protein [Desulfovibrionaceae bacterium]
MLHYIAKLLGRAPKVSREQVMRVFKRRYVSFKDLLQSNTDLANIMAGLEQYLHGDSPITTSHLRAEATKAVFHTMRMVSSLNAISKDAYAPLAKVVESINSRIIAELDQRPEACQRAFTLPLTEITAAHADHVGGKCANLGEIANVVGLPVPRGFAVTTSAYSAYVHSGEVLEEVRKLLRNAQVSDPASIQHVSDAVQALLLQVPLPPAVEHALYTAWDEAFGADAALAVASLRSSAVDEDGHHSFAGQYRTILGVHRETLIESFRAVAASLFSPRAITYRLSHGYIFEQSLMAMVCLEMVDAVAAGVAFSRHPVNLHTDSVVINGLWGLGELVVDGGATPDSWEITRDGHMQQQQCAHKEQHLQLAREGTGSVVQSLNVPVDQRDIPCLTATQAQEVARLTLQLEQHYHRPQDVEWALNTQGQIILLQSRPMRMADGRVYSGPPPQRIAEATLLFEGADIAATGIGCGPVVLAEPEDDLTTFPEGGVLVTRHSSPNMVVVMDRAAAIVADTGSLTGHMASVCRECHMPTLLNVPNASSVLQAGHLVTVDALSGRIYAGEVPALLRLKHSAVPAFTSSPVHALFERVAEHILPLHLIDPKSSLFSPAHCTSLHDVMRFVHEQSYTEMFRLSDSASEAGAVAVRLKSIIPLDLHVIDLGEGLENPESPIVHPENVTSWPFTALLKGMLRPEVHSRGPRPVDMGGFFAVMSQSMIGGNNSGGERFGERSYAIVSDHYLNFSSRVGYHYAVLDAWCGNTMNKNYITFKFAGGAADETRRNRRVRCIGEILAALDFRVDILGDRIQARFQKYPREAVEARLDQLGRLLIVTRQMDMLMTTEEAIKTFAEKFLREEYH